MKKMSIYDYNNFCKFLQDFDQQKRRELPHAWSLSLWSRQLGLSGAAVLTNIIHAKRSPGPQIQQKLCYYFQFSIDEETYFKHLILLGKHKANPQIKTALVEQLKKMSPNKKIQFLDDTTFNCISEWYYYAIREMVALESFKEDPHWIAKNLNFKVGLVEIKKALREMLELGLLSRDSEGKLIRTHQTIKSTTDIPKEAIRHFHQQMITHAKEALEEFSVEKRDISARTFNLPVDRLPELKKYISEFRDKVSELFEEENHQSATFQLNIQLFPLTKWEKNSINKGKNNEYEHQLH